MADPEVFKRRMMDSDVGIQCKVQKLDEFEAPKGKKTREQVLQIVDKKLSSEYFELELIADEKKLQDVFLGEKYSIDNMVKAMEGKVERRKDLISLEIGKKIEKKEITSRFQSDLRITESFLELFKDIKYFA